MIRVSDVSKDFYFYGRPWLRVADVLSGGRMRRAEVFRALDAISFEVARGRSLAIVGANGAGKSTLLRILAGTLHPTSGEVEIRGRVAALLELGTGFHPDFTGRQNAVLNARLLGMDDAEIDARMPEIVAFAELGDFIDRPLRTYSAGMKVRLGFGVAGSVSPDVLLIDEALAVGDAYFQQKCVRRIREFRERGVTVLFVSHDFAAVRTLCDEAVLLEGGRLIARGRPDDVLERYSALVAAKSAGRELLRLEPPDGGRRSGTFEALLAEVGLHDASGAPVRAFSAGTSVEIRVRIHFLAALSHPTIGILIRDRLGNDVYGTNTFLQGIETGDYRESETVTVSFHLDVELGPGEYTLGAAVHDRGTHVLDAYDWGDGLIVFQVIAAHHERSIGVARLEPRIEVGAAKPDEPPHELLARLFGPASRSLDLLGPACVFGWYAPEGEGASVFRWTGARFAFFLDLAGERLCLDVAADRPDGAVVRAEVKRGGATLGSLSVAPGAGFSTVSVAIPPGSRADLVSVSVSDPWCPADGGVSTDARRLGLRVRRVWVE